MGPSFINDAYGIDGKTDSSFIVSRAPVTLFSSSFILIPL
jgi:hypothetical protein